MSSSHNMNEVLSDITREAGELRNGNRRKARSVIIGATGDLIGLTPRDFGQAAAGWFPSVGTPSTFAPPEPPKIPGRKPRSGELGQYTALQQEHAAAAEALAMPDAPAFSLFVTNNVGHINALNDGHSQQAPTGMTEQAAVRAENLWNRLAAE